jgi:hypothetical protein
MDWFEIWCILHPKDAYLPCSFFPEALRILLLFYAELDLDEYLEVILIFLSVWGRSELYAKGCR